MPRRFSRRLLMSMLSSLALGVTVLSSPATAAPDDDRVLPADQYRSEKARQLAVKYASALRALNTSLYHCLPWTDVQKHSIGFYKPKDTAGDDRYLSARLYVEQDFAPAFARMSIEERASSMFSRYVIPMLRMMTRERRLLDDPAVAGFAVLLEWRKHGVRGVDSRPIHETIAVFTPKPLVLSFLARAITTRDLAARSRVLGFDGETHLGPLAITGWDDDFVRTYKVSHDELPPDMTCP